MKELTKSQYLLWAGQMLSPDAPLYNMPFRFDFYAKIDPSLFEKAHDQLVEECDIMRTVFVLDEESLPRQKIVEKYEPLKVLDFSQKNHPEKDLSEWIEDKNSRLFDLTSCLFESALIKLSDEHWVWYLNQHHLITDAWGISVQFKRLSSIYENLLKNEDVGESLPSFLDYQAYETQRDHPNEKKKFWKSQLNRLPPLPSLYNFKSTRLDSSSTRYHSPLSQDQIERLKPLIYEVDIRSFTEHISQFSIYMTCLMAYIYRVSGQSQIVIGTPSHNRSNATFQNTPGVFIEFFPITTQIDEGESLGALYQKVRQEVMSFLMNSDTGMASPELSSSFNVVLNYIHAEFGSFAGLPTKSEWLHIGHCDPRHDLRVHVMDYKNDGQAEIMFDMNDRVFARKAEAAQGQFERIFNQFLDDRSAVIDEIPLVERREPELSGVDLTQSWTIHEKTAVLHENQTWSYEDLLAKVRDVREFLLSQGVQSGDRIAVYSRRSPEALAAIYGILQVGAAFVPIPSDAPVNRVQSIAGDADVKGILSDSSLSDVQGEVWQLHDIPEGQGSGRLPLLRPNSLETAYIMYTSGSTGTPKGVEVSHKNLSHYLSYAIHTYAEGNAVNMPWFTSMGFDLSITTMFLPVLVGGGVHIYSEPVEGSDLSVLDVVENEALDVLKWTPSHMEMVKDKPPMKRLRLAIVGGEDFRTELADSFYKKYDGRLTLINEYGPTEATVGTITQVYHPKHNELISVPIGKPMPHVDVRIVNRAGLPQPPGVSGEILLGGPAVATGYWEDEEKTHRSFEEAGGRRFYHTGDLAHQDEDGVIHFQGRLDQQIKVGGRRMEPGEIAHCAEKLPEVEQAVVALVGHQHNRDHVIHCKSCGLPSNFPGVSFNEDDVCSLCENFDSYQERVKDYFKDMSALHEVFRTTPKEPDAEYDCIMLLSGGKDSTYALAQLADMGLKVLAFTLDNGYISQEALDNARRVCQSLGVDHVFGRTEAMNEIFVDSLERFNNVCNGCFKVIYTLSTKIALEKKIPIIVTGLSRGQFFETRLTEELFWDEEASPEKIDQIILNARKEYHRTEDAVSRLMDTSFFWEDDVFEKVRFVDFYRYSDVELSDLMDYLKEKLPWVRPSDTGRSTNCLINQLGIHVHKKNVGYSNYAFPYSWDVRIGHKNREESLDEINEEIDVPAVERMMDEIGYNESKGEKDQHLTIFYKTRSGLSAEKLKSHLSAELPNYMVPWSYVAVEDIPLTRNGKVDRQKLIDQYRPEITAQGEYVAPESDFEKMIAEIWEEVLLQDRISVADKFLEIGGNSLIAIRIISRMNKKFRLDLNLKVIFEQPTIRSLAQFVEDEIRRLMAERGLS